MASARGVLVACRGCHSSLGIFHPAADNNGVIVECVAGKFGAPKFKCKTKNFVSNQALCDQKEWGKWDTTLKRYVLIGGSL